MGAHPMNRDWTAVRAEYANNLRVADVAARHDVSLSTLMRRARGYGWKRERRRARWEVEMAKQQAAQKAVRDAAAELAVYNGEDLEIAKTLRAIVAQHLKRLQELGRGCSPHELRCLAQSVSEAQRIARLALGAATATMQDIPAEFNVDAARERLFAEMLAGEERPQ
jgi:DNA-binding MurR/RpiR family transcriptional regulator